MHLLILAHFIQNSAHSAHFLCELLIIINLEIRDNADPQKSISRRRLEGMCLGASGTLAVTYDSYT